MSHTIESPEVVGCSSDRLARIRPIMQSYVDHHGFAGLSTMLVRRGRLIHFEQVGWQDRENKTALSPDTIFRIYSLTKPIICVAFMTLYEEGRFQLFDPVAKYLPAFARMEVLDSDDLSSARKVEAARPITIGDLLTQTAGLTYDFLEDSPVSKLYREAGLLSNSGRSLEELTTELAKLPLAYQPGTRWHYSMAIDVIAHLIEVISDKPLQDFLQERIFTPLEMTDTGFSVTDSNHHRLAAMYGHPDIANHTFSQIAAAWKENDCQRLDVELTYPAKKRRTFFRGGHGLFSTAGDLMRFALMLHNFGELAGVRILAPAIVDFMHTNHLPPHLLPYEIAGITRNGYGYGLGSRVLLNVAESSLPGATGEFGWQGAAKTYYWVDRKNELIGILMAQFMIDFELPEKPFQVLAYQALLD